MFKLCMANLLYRKARSIVAILAVGVAAASSMAIIGLTEGTVGEVISRVSEVGADLVVQPLGTNFFSPVKHAPLTSELAEEIRSLEGVNKVLPVISWALKTKGQMHVIYGLDIANYTMLNPGKFNLVKGRFPSKDKYELLIDTRLAKASGLKPPRKIQFLGHWFTVSGIYKAGIGARAIAPIQTFWRALGIKNRASFFYVKCSNRTAAKEISRILREKYTQVDVRSSGQFDELFKSALAGLYAFMWMVYCICIIVSGLVVLLFSYVNVLSRYRQIGLLKSMGASKSEVAGIVLLESLILSISGLILGLIIFLVFKGFIIRYCPLLSVKLSIHWILFVVGASIVVAVTGGCMPAILAAIKDPVDALRYE